MSSNRQRSFYRKERFQEPDNFKKYISPYQFDSNELENLDQQHIEPIFSQTILLSTAQLPTNPLEIIVPARGFMVKGFTTATQYDFAANTGIETVVTTCLVGIWVNKVTGPSNALLLKHGQGYVGDLLKVFLFWPAQANNSARITFFKFDETPFMGDRST